MRSNKGNNENLSFKQQHMNVAKTANTAIASLCAMQRPAMKLDCKIFEEKNTTWRATFEVELKLFFFLACNLTFRFDVALELENAPNTDVRALITFCCTEQNAFFYRKIYKTRVKINQTRSRRTPITYTNLLT